MAGAAAVGGAVMIGKASEDYQVAMKQIEASTGASAAQMNEMKTVAKNLYNQNIGEDWGNLAQVMGQAKQVTQQTGAQLQNTTRNAVVLEKTFENLDVTSSLKTAQTMARNFGVGTDEAFNLFAQGAQKGLDYSGELLDSANEYATYFNKIGFSAEDMFNTFSAGMENGAFNLDKVGDAIKEFGIRSKDGSKASAAAYQSIGLNAAQMTAKFAQGGAVAKKAYAEVGKALAAVKDPVVQNAAAVGLFGTQAEDLEMKTILALTNVRDQYDMTADTMGQIAEIKYSTLGQALKGIGRQLNTAVVIPLTEAALPALSSFSNWFAQAGPKVSGFFSKLGGSKGFSQVKTFVADALENVKWLFANGFDGEMEGVTENYAKMLGFDGPAAEAIGAKARTMFVKAQEAFTGFKNFITPIMNNIQTAFGKGVTVVQAIFQRLAPVFLQVGGIIIGAVGRIIGALAPIVAYMTNTVGPIIGQVLGFIGTTVIPGFIAGFQKILPAIQNVANMIGPLMTAIWNFVKPVIDSLVATFQAAWPTIQVVVMTAIDIISGVVGGLLTTLGGVITFVTGVFSGNWAQAWEGIKGIFSGVWEGIKSIAVGAINGVIRIINNGISKINGLSFDMPDVLGGAHVGINVPTIPEIGGGGSTKISTGAATNKSSGRMQAFARGGLADRPSIFGEAGPEMAIPLNNNPRSHSLLEQTNRMMGHETGGGQPVTIEYSPQIIIQGNADATVVKQAQDDGYREFAQHMDRYFKQQRRVSFG